MRAFASPVRRSIRCTPNSWTEHEALSSTQILGLTRNLLSAGQRLIHAGGKRVSEAGLLRRIVSFLLKSSASDAGSRRSARRLLEPADGRHRGAIKPLTFVQPGLETGTRQGVHGQWCMKPDMGRQEPNSDTVSRPELGFQTFVSLCQSSLK